MSVATDVTPQSWTADGSAESLKALAYLSAPARSLCVAPDWRTDCAPPQRRDALLPNAYAVAPLRRPLATVTVLHPPRKSAGVATSSRLTQRGIVVLTSAVLLLGVVLVWLARTSAPAAVAPAVHPAVVTVETGDTLWAIAGRVAPQRDPRAEVAALQARNHLNGVDLSPGQSLVVP